MLARSFDPQLQAESSKNARYRSEPWVLFPAQCSVQALAWYPNLSRNPAHSLRSSRYSNGVRSCFDLASRQSVCELRNGVVADVRIWLLLFTSHLTNLVVVMDSRCSL